jgi:ATP synthase protein I
MSNKPLPEKVLKSSQKKTKPALNFLLLSAGSVFTSMIVAGFLVGYALDMLFETTPIFMLFCGVLGFIGGILKIHKLLEKMDLMDVGVKSSSVTESKKEKDESK